MTLGRGCWNRSSVDFDWIIGAKTTTQSGQLFDVTEGDITQMNTDAVVNAANNHFWMGGGVAGAIKHEGSRLQLSELYRVVRLYVNFFQPSKKPRSRR